MVLEIDPGRAKGSMYAILDRGSASLLRIVRNNGPPPVPFTSICFGTTILPLAGGAEEVK
jgi:hypothetical protein